MAKPELTKRQQQILDFVKECIEEKHYPPSVREIGEAIGLSSPSTVHAHLNALERKGYIKRDGAKSRSMVVTAKQDGPKEKTPQQPESYSTDALGVVTLPLVGNVAAGQPILAEQNIEEQVPVPKNMFGDSNSFLLKVRGESMVEIGICDGDYVIVREQHDANNGDIVVALLDDGATVKTFYREKDCIRLQPQNASMEPIFSRDVQILGIVTGLFRCM